MQTVTPEALEQRLLEHPSGACRLHASVNRSKPGIPLAAGVCSGPAATRLTRTWSAPRLRDLGGTPEPILASEDMLELLLPSLRADLAIAEAYVAERGEPLPCPITAIAGRHDPVVTTHEVGQWAAHSTRGTTVVALDSEHFFLEERRDELLRVVAPILTGAAAHRHY